MEVLVHDSRQLMRAVSDPSRLRLLNLLSAQEMSAAEAAREMGVTQALASYHLRKLFAVGLVEVVRTHNNRGATEKVYGLTSMGREPVSVGEGSLVMLVEAVAGELRRRVGASEREAPSLVSDAEVWAPVEVVEKVRRDLAESISELIRSGRPPGSPGAVPVSVTAVLFRMDA
ncbi:helix-turn-helix domain-containing protein [Streptomyces sp. NPDC048416]|uniref:helix-turn-helix domain-containing protein n=1 Tax=Streptomyces sp. NPDC048416 TaxID=3365546 RepID=UPI00371B03D8